MCVCVCVCVCACVCVCMCVCVCVRVVCACVYKKEKEIYASTCTRCNTLISMLQIAAFPDDCLNSTTLCTEFTNSTFSGPVVYRRMFKIKN